MSTIVPSIDFSNPFEAALVFLGHSWDDNAESDYLFNELKGHFRIWYDRGSLGGAIYYPGLNIGEPILPRRIIAASDFVLFLASASSMAERTISARELSIAEIETIRLGHGLGLIELAPFRIPAGYGDLKFETFSLASGTDDAARIIDAVKRRLTEIGKLIPLPGTSAPIIYSGSDDLDMFLDAVNHPSRRGLFALNVIPRAAERERLITRLLSMPNTDQEDVTDALLSIYMTDVPGFSLVRQSAVYLLARLNLNRGDLAKEVRLRFPREDELFLYRGFHIASGFLGNLEVMREYVHGLNSSRALRWSQQRKLNRDFHTIYYGSATGALTELRETIRTQRPLNLLELNVYTLGDMSSGPNDADLLKNHQEILISNGVEPRILRSAIRSIRKKARS